MVKYATNTTSKAKSESFKEIVEKVSHENVPLPA
jgi:hypothetical protein